MLIGLPINTALTAQSLHHTYNKNEINLGQAIIKGHGGHYLIGGSVGQVSTRFYEVEDKPDAYVALIDAEGNIVWNRFLEVGGQNADVRALAYDSEAAIYYVLTPSNSCDFQRPLKIHQIDTTGTLLGSWELNDQLRYLENMVFLDGLGLFFYSDRSYNQTTLLDEDYQPVFATFLWLSDEDIDNYVYEAIQYKSRSFALTRTKDIISARITEDTLTIDEVYPMPFQGVSIDYMPSENALINLTQGRIYKHGEYFLDTIASASVEGLGIPLKVQCTDDLIYALFAIEDKIHYRLVTIDPDLNNQAEVAYWRNHERIVEWITDGDKVIAIGTISSPDVIREIGDRYMQWYNKGSDTFLRSFDQTGISSTGVDVLLDSLKYDSLSAVLVDSISGQPAKLYLDYYGLSVEATNQGVLPVNSLTINIGDIGDSRFCKYTETTTRTFHDLDISPGETKTIYFGDHYAPDVLLYSSWDTVQTQYDHCMWAANVNGKLDDAYDNNITCLTLDPTSYALAEEETILGVDTVLSFHISPKPCAGFTVPTV